MIKFNNSELFLKEKVCTFKYPIRKILEFKSNVFVLLDPNSYTFKFGQFHNLVCYSLDGDILWTAALPSNYPGDRYYDIQLIDEKLKANSYDFIDCEIDINSGKVLSSFYNR